MFDPTATNFSLANALFLAQASQAAYSADVATIRSALNLSAAPALFECAPKGVQGFITHDDGFTLLAFRGTSNIEGWLTDDCIVQVRDPYYPGLVHWGFASALDAVWDQIRKMLENSAQAARIWVTGHSLGGALASLAAGRLQAGGMPVQQVHTFGSPRTANVDYCQAYTPATYRFVHNADIVPHVPLNTLLLKFAHFSYKHVGALKYLDNSGRLCESIDWPQRKAGVLDALKLHGGAWPEAISDHFIGNYISALQRNLSDAAN
jgi:triacylglycerol lipase